MSETREEFFVRDDGLGLVAAGGSPVLGVKENEVNIRAVVKLLAPEFSEGHHRKTALRDAVLGVAVLRMAVAFG